MTEPSNRTNDGELARRKAALTPEQQALLARWISGADRWRSIPRRRDPGPAPLSFAQERLWFIERLMPGTRAYELPTALILTGRLAIDPLRRALTEIVRRHEALRTRFPAPGGRAVQIVDPPSPVPLADTDGVLDADEARFDLATGPLLRATLARTGPDAHELRIVTHHIVADAWSQRVLVREFAALYGAFVADEPSPLPELPIQYADFAVWQRDQLAGRALANQLDYWRDRLAGPPPVLALPTDRPRPPVPTHGGATCHRPLPATLPDGMRELCRRTNTTRYMVALAGLVTLLHRITGETDIAVGTPVAGRGHVDVENLIGFFANTIVLRIDIADDPTGVALLRRVRETALAAFANADLPFARVVEAVRPPRRLDHTALFQVQLIVQERPAPVPATSDLTVDVATLDARGAPYDLTVVLSGDTCRIDYSTDLFDEATVAGLADALVVLLGGMVADPDQRCGELPGPAPRRRTSASTVDGRMGEPAPPVPYRAPHTELERTVADIWAAELGVDRVGLDDSFFDLGGHSVQLIQVHERICAHIGRSVDVIDVFAHPTVAALAAHLDAPADAGNHADDRLARSQQAAVDRRAALARLGGRRGGPHAG